MSKDQLIEELRNSVIVADGGTGTELIRQGAPPGVIGESLNLSHPDIVTAMHKSYFEAGSTFAKTNTFSSNRIKLGKYGLLDKFKEINEAAVKLAREAEPDAFINASLGPLDDNVEPVGKLTFDQVYDEYYEWAKTVKKADTISIETMADIKLFKAACTGVRAACPDKPILGVMTFSSDGNTIFGSDPMSVLTVYKALDVDIIGTMCSITPPLIMKVIQVFANHSNRPIAVWPNAGIPDITTGRTIYTTTPQDLAFYGKRYVELGANIIGGCCGTSPEHIAELARRLKGLKPKPRQRIYHGTLLSSRSKTVSIHDGVAIVGERINPSGREDLQEELKQGKTLLVRKEALAQVREGANVLDVNTSIVGIDNKEILTKAIDAVQNTTSVPICIDTPDLEALEAALKKSDGKPLINSTTGERNKMEKVFALAKKYGAAVIGLTIDERGMPKTAEERFEIANKIVEFGSNYIQKHDILIDCLTRTVSAEQGQAMETLKAVKRIKEELGVRTILGISNISHGLPNRPLLNATFLKMAKGHGLDVAIYNPRHLTVSPSDAAEKVLTGVDANASEYIKAQVDFKEVDEKPKELTIDKRLEWDIVEGNDEDIVPAVEMALSSGITDMEIGDKLIVALRIVGEKFNNGEVFLPQVMLAASAMKKAFGRLKQELKAGEGTEKGTVLFATVKDDVHDLGKSIVISMLEANNYKVVDLGVDIDASVIVKKAKEIKPDVIALSTLMTTTVVNVPKVIEELKNNNINTPVMVGGAVVTDGYAEGIGATYSKDAIGAVDLISKLLSKP